MASWFFGGRDWNACCGNNSEDTPRLFCSKRSIKAISGDLHVSRKVVRKVIRSEATEFQYQRETQPLPKVGPWRDQVDELLMENENKSSRERLTIVRLF